MTQGSAGRNAGERRRARIRIPGLLITLLILASSIGSPAAAASDRLQLRVGYIGDVPSVHPLLGAGPIADMITRHQYLPLVGRGVNNEPVPELARSWTTSEDGTEWTFSIDTSQRWSDGVGVSAEDAQWTVEAIQDSPELPSVLGSGLAGVASVEATDEQTLVITLAEPQAVNPLADLPILPAHIWEGTDLREPPDDRMTVGSGPFVMDGAEVEGNSENKRTIDLVTNPNFHRGPAQFEGITFRSFADEESASAALVAADIDFVSGISPPTFAVLADEPVVGTHIGNGRGYTSLIINQGLTDTADSPYGNGNEALADPLVRQAIQNSVNVEAIVERLLDGYAEPGLTQIPPVYPDLFGLAAGIEPYRYDPELANQLLDQAGILLDDEQRRLGLDSEPIVLELPIDAADAPAVEIAESLAESVGEIGIEVSVEELTSAQWTTRMANGDYDLLLGGAEVAPDPEGLLQRYTCDARRAAGDFARGPISYCNAEYDNLFDDQQTSLDPQRRSELVRQALSTMYRDAVERPLFYPQRLEVYRSDRFSGFQPQPAQAGVIAFQNSYWGFYSALPVTVEEGPGEVTPAPSERRFEVLGWVVGIVAVTGGVAAAVLVVVRRRSRRS